ncbi:helix-turn-helix domain-containing protein [Lactiplantibacillus herbarum]|uniref:helix-turn-helix domain-containing protein n=1 Tax=Lactiplantibacillus herbarum TaxID=1670446 RepID=UPI00064EDB0E|nr:helix-turn-helix transcriptional regulator [Lactiplantibacillus herbarum]
MTLFENVKKLASKRGISLLRLNDQAGLGKNAIYKWKKQNPSTENLQKVATVLGVSTAELTGEEDNPAPKHIDVEDIVNESAMLTSRNHALSNEDRTAIRALLETYLNSKEGQDRLRKFGGYGNDGQKTDKK